MENTNRKHVAIVGGGLAGLATAAYLGRAGRQVTVFERSDSLGGRGGSTEHAGYIHNFGPHALYCGGTAEEVLADLGVSYTGKVPQARGVAVRGGRTYTLPASARSMVATRLLGVRARVEVGRQLLALRKPSLHDTRTVRQWLDEEFHHPAARDYVEAIIRIVTYANAPDEISFQEAGWQFASGTAGVLYLDGGWQTIVEGLRSAALSAGAAIRTSARVERVEATNGRVTLRLAGDETLTVDAAVLAVSAAVARELAPSVASLAAHADGALPARAACLDVGLARLPNPRRPYGIGMDVPFYLSVHSAYARLAPEGKVLLSVAKYIPAGSDPDAGRDLAELEAFVDLVQPGWREFEEHRQYLPNMVVTTALPRASTGGIAARPSPALRDADGLFVAGDWVGQGGWLADGTLGSAREAAGLASEWLAGSRTPALAAVS